MDITIISKEGCKKCNAAKKKMNDFNIKFIERDIYSIQALHDNWRNDDTAEIMAHYYMYDTLPVFKIDGRYMSYPDAIKELKANGYFQNQTSTSDSVRLKCAGCK